MASQPLMASVSGRATGLLQRTHCCRGPVELPGPRCIAAPAIRCRPLRRATTRRNASESDSTTTTTATAAPPSQDDREPREGQAARPAGGAASEQPRIKRTMADLDALLGIKEEDAKKAMQASSTAAPASTTSSDKGTGTDTSGSTPSTSSPLPPSLPGAKKSGTGTGGTGEVEDHIQKIIDKARKLADEQSAKGSNPSSELEQAALKREFESLLTNLTKPEEMLTKDEIKALKEAAFGPLTFWVTETRPIQEAERTGLLIRGNLRDQREKVFSVVCAKVKELFGGKFEVFMIEDTEGEDDGMQGAAAGGKGARANLGPRVAFQVVPAAQALPPQTDTVQKVCSVILGLLTFGSTLELALASNITKLPKETLDYFANPNNLNSDQIPPGLENWDPSAYLACVIPLLGAVLAVNLAHEAGHRVAAATKGVKLGPSFFIPFGEVGSFGAITPFTSLLKNRNALWDVAGAGPLAGGALAAVLLLFGLFQSSGVDPADAAATAMMVKVPTLLFQGSLLLGGLARLTLGSQALHGTFVTVSPFVIAGWVGLITNALNMLPVGSLDGGRLVQAAYGRQALALTSFFTYVGLGLGLLGGPLALPFGLYVLICQRTAEKYIQDNVEPAGNTRMAVTAAAVLTALLVLVPMAPELADAFGIGPTRF